MAQMIAIYKTPRNPAAFHRHYFEALVDEALSRGVKRVYAGTQGGA